VRSEKSPAIILEDRGRESLSFVPFQEKNAMPLNQRQRSRMARSREKDNEKQKEG